MNGSSCSPLSQSRAAMRADCRMKLDHQEHAHGGHEERQTNHEDHEGHEERQTNHEDHEGHEERQTNHEDHEGHEERQTNHEDHEGHEELVATTNVRPLIRIESVARTASVSPRPGWGRSTSPGGRC